MTRMTANRRVSFHKNTVFIFRDENSAYEQRRRKAALKRKLRRIKRMVETVRLQGEAKCEQELAAQQERHDQELAKTVAAAEENAAAERKRCKRDVAAVEETKAKELAAQRERHERDLAAAEENMAAERKKREKRERDLAAAEENIAAERKRHKEELAKYKKILASERKRNQLAMELQQDNFNRELGAQRAVDQEKYAQDLKVQKAKLENAVAATSSSQRR